MLVAACGSADLSSASSAEISAIEASGLKRGSDFLVLNKGVQHESDKIVVAEYFWYGCGHCLAIEETAKKWKRQLPDGAEFIRVPANWHPDMALHAAIYYSAETLHEQGALTQAGWDTLHSYLFRTIGQLSRDIGLDQQRQTFQALFANFDIDAKTFNETLDSDTVKEKVRRAERWQKISKIPSTPTFIIDGNFHIPNDAYHEDKNALIIYGNRIIKALIKTRQAMATESSEQ